MLAYLTFTIGFLYLLRGTTGAYTVTLVVYSGRVDPQWEVADAKKVLQTQLIKAKEANALYSPNNVPGRLGYKGFFVLEAGKRQTVLVVGKATANLQILLLGSMPVQTISANLRRAVQNAIKKGVAEPQLVLDEKIDKPDESKSGAKFRTKRATPYFELDRWIGAHQVRNNCYNFGTNKRTGTYAQPGRRNGAMYTAMTAAAVRTAAVQDNLVRLNPQPAAVPAAPSGPAHLVALFVAPTVDFHWYRLGPNGRWFHKPGEGKATRLDAAGRIILDPRAARNGEIPYKFVSFMTVNPADVKIN